MQRQAVPLLYPQKSIVGTGLEGKIARDSRTIITAEEDGVIEFVDSNQITVKYNRNEMFKAISFEGDSKTYQLTKFRKTNQSTCVNLKPTVVKGQKVTKGQVLCEGYATDGGELALGSRLDIVFYFL